MFRKKAKKVFDRSVDAELRLNFRSGFEKRIYESCKEQGFELDYEPKYGLLKYNKPSTYLPDFVLRNGIRIEAKGYFSGADRAKMLRVRADNPSIDIRFVFQRANNRLTKSPNSLMYWQWAEKHDFLWAEGHIPEEWFHE